MTATRAVAGVLTAPLRARTWRETAYLLGSLGLAVPGTALLVVTAVAVPLSVLTVGLPLLLAALATLRGWAGGRRRLGRLLHRDWTAPPALRRAGALAWCRAQLTDPVAWRALAAAAAGLPLAFVAGYAVVVLLGIGLVALTCPMWWWLSSTGAGLLEVGSWRDSWVVAVGGLLLVLLFPWVVRLLTLADTALVGGLLAVDARDRRIGELEQARSQLTEDAAATLRRLERDLHDGTQASLVSVGMALSRARSRVATLPDDQRGDLDELLAGAQATVQGSLTELRDLVRGLHPPALDAGLGTALHTLVSRSGLPVGLDVDLQRPPREAVASAAYFCAAELLTNAARHSGATRVELSVRERPPGVLRLVVRDDGHGGAGATGSGSGLAGLRRRVTALDGALSTESPPGGPTTVTVTLPAAGPGRR